MEQFTPYIRKRVEEHDLHVRAVLKDQYRGYYTALYGSQNYGTALEGSDIDTKTIVIPTFSQMVNRHSISKETHPNGENAEVKDIRTYLDLIIDKPSINFLEILFTDYYVVSPEYERWFETLRINREFLAAIRREKLVWSAFMQMRGCMKDYENYVDTDFPKASKALYNAMRLHLFAHYYYLGLPFSEAINCKALGNSTMTDVMMSLKRVELYKMQTENIAHNLASFAAAKEDKYRTALATMQPNHDTIERTNKIYEQMMRYSIRKEWDAE